MKKKAFCSLQSIIPLHIFIEHFYSERYNKIIKQFYMVIINYGILSYFSDCTTHHAGS